MMMIRIKVQITLANLEEFLMQQGFTLGETTGDHRYFQHLESDTIFVMPRIGSNDLVPVPNLTAIRRIMDERGLMEQSEFDGWLLKTSKNSPVTSG